MNYSSSSMLLGKNEQWLISGVLTCRRRTSRLLLWCVLLCSTIFSWKNYLHPKNEWEVCCKKDLHLGKTVLGHFTDHSLYCVYIVPVSKKMYKKDLVLSCNAQFIKLGRLMALWRKWIFFSTQTSTKYYSID